MAGITAPGAGASYDIISPAQKPENEGGVTTEVTHPEEDSAEISNSEKPPITYGPRTFGDRFKFNIQNGMLDGSLRFNANTSRARGASVAAYAERQAVEFQVIQAAGSGSPSSALFALQFLDANPNNSTAGSQVEGRVEFNRMAEQNLNLLSTL
jgi:hypothetical protein